MSAISKLFRTSLTLPEDLSKDLVKQYEQENPKDDQGSKIPYGQWLGGKAMARIRDEKSGRNNSNNKNSFPLDIRAIELAALDGGQQGAMIGMKRFAIELGKIFGDRLDQQEKRLDKQDQTLKDIYQLLGYLVAVVEGDAK